jgi:hypothetical protein
MGLVDACLDTSAKKLPSTSDPLQPVNDDWRLGNAENAVRKEQILQALYQALSEILYKNAEAETPEGRAIAQLLINAVRQPTGTDQEALRDKLRDELQKHLDEWDKIIQRRKERP